MGNSDVQCFLRETDFWGIGPQKIAPLYSHWNCRGSGTHQWIRNL